MEAGTGRPGTERTGAGLTGNARSTPDVRRERTRSRRASPTSEDAQLIAEYRDVLRAELRATLAELRPKVEPGLFAENVKRAPLADRVTLVGLADRIARALLGLGELDDVAAPPVAPVKARRRPRLGSVGGP